MMKKIFSILSCCLFVCLSLSAQELQCNVVVNYDQIPGSNNQVFKTMQRAISDFLNQNKWTDFRYENNEKIICNILITVSEMADEKNFKASLQVQARRPIYNSSYQSPIFNFQDENFNFEYIEHTPLEFVENQFGNNLSAMLAYYAYLIIGYDCDSYAKMGGTALFEKAETIVNLAQGQSFSGWKAFEDPRNRYALINNILDDNLRKVREAFYFYHRLGLDEMFAGAEKGVPQVTQVLTLLKEANSVRPSCVFITSFLDAKRDEIINIYSNASKEEKKTAYGLLMDIDPVMAERYEQILK